VIGAGGGGDVVGALAAARFCESLGTPFALGGVAWERMPIDPHPGPRPVAQIEGGRPLGANAVLASATTTTPDGVPFSESRMAGHLGQETVLIDVSGGPAGVADGLASACDVLGCDLVVLADVGGDVIARGDEPELASPLCDAVMLAATVTLADRVRPLLAVVGPGCDGELTAAEVMARVALAAAAGAWIGTTSVSPQVATEIEGAAAATGTEASLQVARCAHGELGEVPIRKGRRSVELGPAGALCLFLDPLVSLPDWAPLTEVVAGAGDLVAARDALAARGVRTELDYELERAAESGP
jgi:hypothetical protein